MRSLDQTVYDSRSTVDRFPTPIPTELHGKLSKMQLNHYGPEKSTLLSERGQGDATRRRVGGIRGWEGDGWEVGKEGSAGSHGSWLGSVASDSLLSPYFGGGGVCQEQQ